MRSSCWMAKDLEVQHESEHLFSDHLTSEKVWDRWGGLIRQVWHE